MVINYLDFVSASLCFTSVVFLAKDQRIGWLFSMLTAVASGTLYLSNHLYANALLNIYFISVACYGWFFWKRESQQFVQSLPNHHLSLAFILLAILVLSIVLCQLPFIAQLFQPIDIITTLMSATASYLSSKKIYQNWLLWCLTNMIYLVIFIHAGLWFNALKFACFIFITAKAYLKWENRYFDLPMQQPLMTPAS